MISFVAEFHYWIQTVWNSRWQLFFQLKGFKTCSIWRKKTFALWNACEMPWSALLLAVGPYFTPPTVDPGCRKGRGKEGKGPKPDDVNKMLSVPWRQSLQHCWERSLCWCLDGIGGFPKWGGVSPQNPGFQYVSILNGLISWMIWHLG